MRGSQFLFPVVLILSLVSLACGQGMTFTFARVALKETPTVHSVIHGISSDLRCAAACSSRQLDASACSGFQVLNGGCVLFTGSVEVATTPASGTAIGYIPAAGSSTNVASNTSMPVTTVSMTTEPPSTAIVTTTDPTTTGQTVAFPTTAITPETSSSPTTTSIAVTLPPTTATPLACTSFQDFVVHYHTYGGENRPLCLAAIASPGTYFQAQAECASRGAIVFFPEESQETWTIQNAYHDRFDKSPHLWVGVVYNPSTNIWDGGRSGQFIDSSYDRWESSAGQPDPSGNKVCVSSPYTGQIYSRLCTDVFDYVCEKYDVTF